MNPDCNSISLLLSESLDFTLGGLAVSDACFLPIHCACRKHSFIHLPKASVVHITMHRVQSSVTIEHSVDVTKLLSNPKKELLPLLQSLPSWREAEPRHVHVSQISGAMTNLIYRCHYLPKGQYVLARIFGTSGALFDRDEEQQIFAAVAHAGLGPKLLASFGNGRLEEFLLDQSVTASQMRTTPVATCIAAAMAIFNFTQLTRLPQKGKPKAICWKRLRNWARAVQQLYRPAELQAEGIGNIMEEIDALERGLTAAGPTWMGFCHNDTQYGNMLLHTASQATVEACAEAPDLLDARASLDDQPSGNVVYQPGGLRVELGSSPPSFSSLRLGMGSSKSFSVLDGKDAGPDNWAFEKPDDLEESQGGSPRKHPRGLTFFESRGTSEGASASDTELIDPRLSIRFIDYEYAGMNPVALDIANHWCEYAADYHGPKPHLLDYSKFPCVEQQMLFTRAYVAAVMALKEQKEESGLPTRADSLTHSLAAAAAVGISSLQEDCRTAESIDSIANKVREAALSYVPVSHLSWGIWGLLQARLSDVPSFDFTEYGRQRLHQWKLLQPDFAKVL